MIEIYGKDGCVFCERSKNLLDSLNIPYKYYRLGEHYTLEEFQELFPGQKTVPVIMAEGFKIGGFYELNAYLEETAGGFGDGAI